MFKKSVAMKTEARWYDCTIFTVPDEHKREKSWHLLKKQEWLFMEVVVFPCTGPQNTDTHTHTHTHTHTPDTYTHTFEISP
jgi:hypothetical protein